MGEFFGDLGLILVEILPGEVKFLEELFGFFIAFGVDLGIVEGVGGVGYFEEAGGLCEGIVSDAAHVEEFLSVLEFSVFLSIFVDTFGL